MKAKLKLIQSNFLESNNSRLEKLINKNNSNSKGILSERTNLIIEEDPFNYRSENNKRNLNANKYMLNTFNKSKVVITRNSSGIV